MATYKDLEVYKRAYSCALQLHNLSLELPKYAQYDLADQLRRASRSIPSNIAEGCGRNRSKQEVIHFLKIALGSNDEVLFNLEFLRDTKLIRDDTYTKLSEEYIYLGKQLHNLILYTSKLDNK